MTPLGETGPVLEFEPALLEAKHVDPKAKYYSIKDYHELYKSGRATPLDVAKALLPLTKPGNDNKTRYEDAWANNHGNDELVFEAARASTERWAAGKPLGILDGVPIGVKDDVNVKGYVNHNGMKYNADSPFFKRQEKSAWCVQALQDAGAVVLGKNRMHELGSGQSLRHLLQFCQRRRNHHTDFIFHRYVRFKCKHRLTTHVSLSTHHNY